MSAETGISDFVPPLYTAAHHAAAAKLQGLVRGVQSRQRFARRNASVYGMNFRRFTPTRRQLIADAIPKLQRIFNEYPSELNAGQKYTRFVDFRLKNAQRSKRAFETNNFPPRGKLFSYVDPSAKSMRYPINLIDTPQSRNYWANEYGYFRDYLAPRLKNWAQLKAAGLPYGKAFRRSEGEDFYPSGYRERVASKNYRRAVRLALNARRGRRTPVRNTRDAVMKYLSYATPQRVLNQQQRYEASRVPLTPMVRLMPTPVRESVASYTRPSDRGFSYGAGRSRPTYRSYYSSKRSRGFPRRTLYGYKKYMYDDDYGDV